VIFRFFVLGNEVTQSTTEKNLEYHRENVSDGLCGYLFKLRGSLCDLIPENYSHFGIFRAKNH
jgi:hypothetical protein